VNKDTGKPLSFEILLSNPLFERISLPFAQNLKRLGVDASVRTVDEYQVPAAHPDLRFRHGRRRIRASPLARAMSSAILGLGGRPTRRPARTRSASRIRPSIS